MVTAKYSRERNLCTITIIHNNCIDVNTFGIPIFDFLGIRFYRRLKKFVESHRILEISIEEVTEAIIDYCNRNNIDLPYCLK